MHMYIYIYTYRSYIGELAYAIILYYINFKATGYFPKDFDTAPFPPGRAARASDGATLATGHQAQRVCGGQGAHRFSWRGGSRVVQSGDFLGIVADHEHQTEYEHIRVDSMDQI